jgi:AcrR family transcriptional regulator
MNAARRVFTRDGFEAARIESVASEAGYTRGAYYAHFESKEDLFFALLEEQSTLQLERLHKELESCATNHERLEKLKSFYVSRVSDKQWAILLLEFKLYALRHPKLRARLAKVHRGIRDKLKLAAIATVLPVELTCNAKRSRLQQAVLEGVLRGVALEYAYDPTELSEGEVARMLSEVFDVVVQSRGQKDAEEK